MILLTPEHEKIALHKGRTPRPNTIPSFFVKIPEIFTFFFLKIPGIFTKKTSVLDAVTFLSELLLTACSGPMPKKRPASVLERDDTVDAQSQPAATYRTPYRQFLDLVREEAPTWKYYRWEPLQELSATVWSKLTPLTAPRFFFVTSEEAISDMILYLVHWILFREALRLGRDVVEFSKQVGNFTYAHTFSTRTLATQMRQLRMCNVNNFYDRHSYRMRWCAAALLVLASKKVIAAGYSVPFAGPAVALAATFGILTGSRSMCVYLQLMLESCGDPAAPWCQDLLAKCNDPMVWGMSGGKVRSAAHAIEPMEDSEEQPQQDVLPNAAADEELDEDMDADNADTFGMNQRLTNMMRQCLLEIGLNIFRDLRGRYSWGQINHVGFRPFNLLGFETATKVWTDACARMVSKWRHGSIHDGFLCFPATGSLATKVLQDRVQELLSIAGALEPKQFIAKYTPIPQFGINGGVVRYLALLEGRSMCLGSDLQSCRFQPQILHAVTRKTNRVLKKECTRLGIPQQQYEWPIIENCLCCASKTIDFALGVRSHATY